MERIKRAKYLFVTEKDAEKFNRVCDNLDNVAENIIESVSKHWGEASEILKKYGIIARDRQEVIEKLPRLLEVICSRRIVNETEPIKFIIELYDKSVLNAYTPNGGTLRSSAVMSGAAALYSASPNLRDKGRLGFIDGLLQREGTRLRNAIEDVLQEIAVSHHENLKGLAKKVQTNCIDSHKAQCATSLKNLCEAIERSSFVPRRAKFAIKVLRACACEDGTRCYEAMKEKDGHWTL